MPGTIFIWINAVYTILGALEGTLRLLPKKLQIFMFVKK